MIPHLHCSSHAEPPSLMSPLLLDLKVHKICEKPVQLAAVSHFMNNQMPNYQKINFIAGEEIQLQITDPLCITLYMYI